MSKKTREELVQEAIRLLEQRNTVEAEGLRAARRVNELLFQDEKSDDFPKIKDDAYWDRRVREHREFLERTYAAGIHLNMTNREWRTPEWQAASRRLALNDERLRRQPFLQSLWRLWPFAFLLVFLGMLLLWR